MSAAFRLSIGANIVLMGIVAVLLWRNQTAAPSPVTLRAQSASAQPGTPGTPNVANAVAKPPPKSAGPKVTPAAIAQLEQMGISRDILVNAMIESFNRRWEKRVVALQKKYAPRLVPDREMRELSRESDAARIRELKDALGEDGYRAWDKEQTLRDMNRARLPGDELPMTADEAEQAYRWQKEFNDKARELQMATEDGVADRADAGALALQAQQALDQKLEALLGKQRFSELRGNTDPTTEVYRTYGDLNPTADQANAVVQAQAAYRDQQAALAKRLNENPGNSANVTAELKAMNDAQDESLRRIFGAEAYDNMKRQNDPTYKTLQQYAEAWDLKDDEVQSVYQAVHAFQDQAELTRSAAEMSEEAGQRVNWRTIDTAIEQARQQTEIGLQNTIGPDRVRRLEQNGVLATR